MEIRKVKHVDIELIGDVETTEAKIDNSSLPFIFEMVSKSLYSNPIHSVIREITSNCFDSHKEAGVEDAVIIRKSYDLDAEQYYISFIDVGVGMSPTRIKKTYMKYFSSTKRTTNEEIGGFGIGGKSPLAYADSFDIITRFDGTEYYYTLTKGSSVPELKEIADFPTNERNGTEIKIPVNTSDLKLFENGLITQLCYFDNVYFDNWNIDNNYTIFEGKTFKVRNSYQYSDELHITLGNVAYPINWNAIGMKEIKIPIAVKFNIGELEVTPSREELRYTEETKTILKSRINECIADLKDRFQKQNESTNDFMVYLQNRHKSGVLTLSGNGHELKLKMPKDFGIPLKFIPFEEAGIECPEDPFFEYDLAARIDIKRGQRGATKGYEILDAYGTLYNTVFSEFKYPISKKVGIFTNNLSINQVKQAYYCIILPFNSLNWIITDNRKLTFHGKVEILGLNTERTSKRSGRIFYNDSRKITQLGAFKKLYIYRKVIREFLQQYLYIDSQIEVPEDFKKAYKAEINNTELAKKRKEQKEISVKYFTYAYPTRYSYDINWDRKDIKINSIINHTDIIVYGFEEDKNKFHEAVALFLHKKSFLKYNKDGSLDTITGDYNNKVPRFNDKAIKFYIISKANEKYFKNNRKVVHVNNLIKNNTILRDVATAYYIRKKFYLKDSIIENFDEINTSIYNIIKEIKLFIEENTVYKVDAWTNHQNRTNLFMRQAIEDAIERKYLNQDILKLDAQIEKYFEKVEILKHAEITKDNIQDIIQFLRKHNKKTNVILRDAPDLEFAFPLVIPKPEAREVEIPEPQLISEDSYIADYSSLINLN